MSSKGWKNYKLGELIDITSSKRIFFSEYKPEGIPFFRSKEIIELFNGHEISTELFISEERYEEINNKFGVPKKDDLLLTSVGTLGIPYLVKSGDRFYFKDGNLTWFRNYSTDLLPTYLFYWFQSSLGKYELEIRKIGTTQQALTIDALKKVEILLPPFHTQHRITATLSAMDEKIELNRRTNATLEAIAQAIFKEWFVDFNFPGATGEMVESELGMIPRGWQVKEITNELNIVYGKNLPTSKLIEHGYPVFGGNGMIGFYEQYLYEKSQVIVACRGAASGKVNQSLPKSFVTNNSLVFEIPNKSILNFSYLKYFCLNTDFTSFVSGSAQPQLTIESLRSAYLLIPEAQLLRRFSEITSPLESMMFVNNKQSLYLTQTRDALLPKLMSGEIEA